MERTLIAASLSLDIVILSWCKLEKNGRTDLKNTKRVVEDRTRVGFVQDTVNSPSTNKHATATCGKLCLSILVWDVSDK